MPETRETWVDQAITNERDDHFGYQDYARVLANNIRKAGTPLTVGIFGSWGSGKTSLMHLIDKDVSSTGAKTLWINVWELSNQEEVWHAFLQALMSKVNREQPVWQRVNWFQLLKELARIIARCASRHGGDPDLRDYYLGFRVVVRAFSRSS